jgi:Malectin domain
MQFYRDLLCPKLFFYGITLLGSVLTATQTCAAQNLTVSPTTGAVYQGQTQTFTASGPVTWSLMKGSVGTLQVTSSTQATYSAPAWVTPAHTRAGCQATPEDSVFNTRIDSLPVLTNVNGNAAQNSATWIANMDAGSLTIAPDFGINTVSSSTAIVNEIFDYTPSHNGPYPMPSQATQKREGGAYQTDLNNNGDHHLISVNTSNCQFSEIYKNYFNPRTCLNGSAGCTGRSGVSYSWSSYALPGASTQASNLLYGPTLLHLSEIKSGAVRHALSFTLNPWSLQQLAYWPANSTNTINNNPHGPPYGARLRLKASFDISRFSPQAQTILIALQQYGMFLSDAGGHGPTIYADTDVTADATAMAALGQINAAGLSALDFDVVEESSFIVNRNSMQVNPANGYETPNAFAVLTATPGSGPAVNIPIALGPDIPAVPSPTLYVVAGSSYYLTSSIRGDLSYQPVRWSVVSGVGTVTGNGIYTPPQSVSAPTSAVLRVAMYNNPSFFENLYVTVLPAGANPAGSIRIDVGSGVSTKDQSGDVWLADTAFESAYSYGGGDYPAWQSPGNTAINIYNTFRYTEGDDLTYTLGVPNGNYKIRLMMGAPYNGHSCSSVPCSYNVLQFPTDWGPYNLIANGQVAAHNFDFGIPISYKEATPSDVFIPAQVTNNQLSISVRGNRPDSMAAYPPVLPVLEGIEILPDTTAPHLAIDTQQQTSVPPGDQLQLYAVGWYTSNAVTWSIVSGPGTIDQTGLYSAPSIAPSAAATVTIRATSKANNTIVANVNLNIP